VNSTRRKIWISITSTCAFYAMLKTAREVSLTNVQPTRGSKPAPDHVHFKLGRNTVQ
jgi:hypothetical protein